LIRFKNKLIIKKAQNQFIDETSVDEKPLTIIGNNSPMINHGIGPKPSEKKIINNTIEQIGIQP